MLAYFCILTSVLFLSAISFVIALRARKKHEFLSGKSKFINSRNFYFSGIDLKNSISSNISSVISFYVIFIGNFLVAFGWGALTIIASVFSIFISYLILYKVIIKQWGKCKGCLTVFDYIQKKDGLIITVVPVIVMVFYAASTIGAEIQSLEMLISNLSLSGGSPIDTQGSNDITKAPFDIAFYFIFACLLYTTVGGYRGVLWTDFFQVLIVVIAWVGCLTFVCSRFDEISLFDTHLDGSWASWRVSLSMIPLIIGWVVGSADNWIRTIGSYKGPKNDVDLFSKHAKKVLSGSCLGVMLLIIAPGILGLAIRDVATEYTVNNTSLVPSAEKCNINFSKNDQLLEIIGNFTAIADETPLVTRDETPCSLTVPNADKSYTDYTKYTNYPFRLLPHIVDYYFSSAKTANEIYSILIVMFLMLVAVFAAAITTIDSLVLVICQIFYRLLYLCRIKTKLRKKYIDYILSEPMYLIALVILLIVAFIYSVPILDGKMYLSFGVAAWSGMVFLGSLKLFVCYFPENLFFMRKITYVVKAGWGLWFCIFLIHIFQIVGYINVSEIETTWIESLFKETLKRSTMPLSAFGISFFTGVYIWIANKIHKENKNDYRQEKN